MPHRETDQNLVSKQVNNSSAFSEIENKVFVFENIVCLHSAATNNNQYGFMVYCYMVYFSVSNCSDFNFFSLTFNLKRLRHPKKEISNYSVFFPKVLS